MKAHLKFRELLLQELCLIKNSAVLKLIFAFCFFSALLPAQTDLVKWEKSGPDYMIKSEFTERDYSYKSSAPSYIFSKTLINTYWILVSDLDGDNCPFHPSCSSFLIDAIEETNLFQGTLMFFDRFTRDSNPVNRNIHYPVYRNKRYYDPITLYTIDAQKIKYIPPSVVVE